MPPTIHLFKTALTALSVVPDWTSFNSTLGGRLFQGRPFSLPCFSNYEGKPVTPNEAACAVVQENYGNVYYRVEQYSSVMNVYDEMCPSNPKDQCLLDSADPADPTAYVNKTCDQGSVSPYYVHLSNTSCAANDVKASLKFAKEHGLPLSIKNTGHDFLGRNTNKNSLALWTRGLQNKTFHASFTPAGCSSKVSYRAISFGAGVLTTEAYAFADSVNSTVNGAYVPAVGAAGGWVMGGGQNILAPALGIGSDRARQFVVVTPDGEERIANECQNTDLFWALRGGGGGTFGIVLETTVQAEGVIPLSVAKLAFNSTSNNITKEWYSLLINNSLTWAEEQWGGHIIGADEIVYVTPKLSLAEAQASMKEATAFVESQGGTSTIERLPNWEAFWTKYVVSSNGVSNGELLTASRLIPDTVFKTAAGRANLSAFLGDMIDNGFLLYVPVATPYGYNATPISDTSTTPTWRKAVWHLTFDSDLNWNDTLAERTADVQKVVPFQKRIDELTPGSGSYMNEACHWLSDWQEQWWGSSNYAKLKAIKAKYDPDSLLWCQRCVGSETVPSQYQAAAQCWNNIHGDFD